MAKNNKTGKRRSATEKAAKFSEPKQAVDLESTQAQSSSGTLPQEPRYCIISFRSFSKSKEKKGSADGKLPHPNVAEEDKMRPTASNRLF